MEWVQSWRVAEGKVYDKLCQRASCNERDLKDPRCSRQERGQGVAVPSVPKHSSDVLTTDGELKRFIARTSSILVDLSRSSCCSNVIGVSMELRRRDYVRSLEFVLPSRY